MCSGERSLNDSYENGSTGQILSSQLIEVVATVLGNEEDEEGQLLVLQMVADLLSKAQELLLDHCARLGVISQVALMAGAHEPIQHEDRTKDDQVRFVQLEVLLLQWIRSYRPLANIYNSPLML